MKKRLNLLTALLLAVVMTLCLIPGAAAVEPEEGEKPLLTTVDPDTFSGTITVTLEYNKKPVKGVEVTLYQVGTGVIEGNNLTFVPVEALGADAPALNGLTAKQVKEAIETLTDLLGDMSREERAALAVDAKDSDKNGKIVFDGLEIGVYLAVKTELGSDYLFDPSLVFLPYGSELGWDDDMTVNPKISYDDDDDPEDPPTPPTPPTPPPTDIPNDPPPGGSMNPPSDPSEIIPEEDPPLGVLPQTGLLQWPIPVMAAVGLLLVAIGLLSERKRRVNH